MACTGARGGWRWGCRSRSSREAALTQLSLSGVGIDFAAQPLLSGVTFTVEQGDRWGIVVRNGSGKTTLFRLITGELAPTRGTVARTAGLRIAVLDQLREFAPEASVWDAA